MSSRELPAIEVTHLDYSYRKPRTAVFHDFSLSMDCGKITCVLGHNGAGKTTLLRLIYGTLAAQHGRVAISAPSARTYGDIFFLSDRFGIDLELTLRENLQFRADLLRRDTGAGTSTDLVKTFKLSKHMDVPTGKLSAGYFVRANLVVGLAFAPTLIMLDEPTNSIDPTTRQMLLETLDNERDRGATVIIVTHDLDFAYALADRLVVLDEGEVVVDDTEPRWANPDEFRKAYILFTERSDGD